MLRLNQIDFGPMASKENVLPHATAFLHPPALGEMPDRQFIRIVQSCRFERRKNVLYATTKTVAAGVAQPIHEIFFRGWLHAGCIAEIGDDLRERFPIGSR